MAYDGNPYAYLIRMARLARKDGVINGILIHQGESNSKDPEWPHRVRKIYNGIIANLRLDPARVPLLAGEVVNADEGGTEASANEIIRNLPGVLPNSYVIFSAGVPANPDRLHFTADGQREMVVAMRSRCCGSWVTERAIAGCRVRCPSIDRTHSCVLLARRCTRRRGRRCDHISDIDTLRFGDLPSPEGVVPWRPAK